MHKNIFSDGQEKKRFAKTGLVSFKLWYHIFSFFAWFLGELVLITYLEYQYLYAHGSYVCVTIPLNTYSQTNGDKRLRSQWQWQPTLTMTRSCKIWRINIRLLGIYIEQCKNWSIKFLTVHSVYSMWYSYYRFFFLNYPSPHVNSQNVLINLS